MKYALYRLIVEVRTALRRGHTLSENDVKFINRWKAEDATRRPGVSEDDRRRIVAIHKHVWPTLTRKGA